MTKKVEEVLPEGSVSIESVFQQPDFDRFAGLPELATWRGPVEVGPDDVEKPTRKAHVKSEKSEG